MNLLDNKDILFYDYDNIIVTDDYIASDQPVAIRDFNGLGVAFTLHGTNHIYHLTVANMTNPTDPLTIKLLTVLRSNIKDINVVYAICEDLYDTDFTRHFQRIVEDKLWYVFTTDIDNIGESYDLIGIDTDWIFISLVLDEDEDIDDDALSVDEWTSLMMDAINSNQEELPDDDESL